MRLFSFWFRSGAERLIILKIWKAAVFVMVLGVISGLISIISPNMANAVCGSVGVPADTLTIKVGYFGGPYYVKKVYTLNDFDELPQVEQTYSFIDNMPSICIDSAKGVKLTELLEDAGIDVNSVQKFYFYSTDIKRGWYQCLDKPYLLDIPRYYYPNLPSHWDYETHWALPEAEQGAVRVDAIIAYKDNWMRYADTSDFENYDTSTRFRLLFGQKDTIEHNAPQSAKWVHAIEVMLGGSPPSEITLDQDQLNVKVDSTVRLTATVAPDDATDKSVIWSSSDPSVATVDQEGLVTVVGPGTAIITVSTVVGEMAAACVVNEPEQAEGEGVASAGNNSPGNELQGADVEQQQIAEEEDTETSIFSKQEPGANQQQLAEEDTEEDDVAAIKANVFLEEAGDQPWRVFEMSADAVPLQQQKRDKRVDIYTAVISLSLFLSGAGSRYREYTKKA
jgi:hypothetical protein